MTKTFPTIASHPFANSGKPVMMPWDIMTDVTLFGPPKADDSFGFALRPGSEW